MSETIVTLRDAMAALGNGIGLLERRGRNLNTLPEINQHIRESGGYPFARDRSGGIRTGSFVGMDRASGRPRYGSEHLSQSIADLLAVPIGSRLQRRGYGLPIELLDMPITPATIIEIVAALAKAFRLWEPRMRLRRIQVTEAGRSGFADLVITAEPVEHPVPGLDPDPQTLRIPLTPQTECSDEL